MNDSPKTGLLTASGQVPLEGVLLEAKLSGACSKVTVTQRYQNKESIPVEAVYVFPMEEGSAVCGFEARVGDRLIRGRVEEKEKAFEIYDDALTEGDGAFLLDQERPNIFTASVGNLRPGERVEIAITYVAQLRHEGKALRFQIPTTVSPRYVPAGPPEVGEPDGHRVNPPVAFKVPYGLTLRLEIESDSPLRSIDSPSHPLKVTMLEENRAKVEISSESVALDRDFVLLLEPKEPHQPHVRVAQEEDGTRIAMVSFYPDHGGAQRQGKEVLFLLDCSGSMGGDSMEQAKKALALCLRALSEGDSFNITLFGSSWQSLWKRPKPYSQKTLDKASKYLRQVSANLGGTEILSPLKALLKKSPDPERARQLLLLTDGEVSNEESVIALCRQHSEQCRIFSFGIGAGCSEYLVRGVARATKGASEFIFPGERIEPKVLRMFARVGSPTYKEVTVHWSDLKVEQAPPDCPPVFDGDTVTLYARIQRGSPREVTLRADHRSWQLPLEIESAEKGGPVPILWAREMIRHLEETGGSARGSQQRRKSKEDRTRQRIVELGTGYGLMSSATSYVAVEERSAEEKTLEQAELRKIPIALTVGWGGMGGIGFSAGSSHIGMVVPSAPRMVGAVARHPLLEIPAFLRRSLGDSPTRLRTASPAPAPPSLKKGPASGHSDGLLGRLFKKRAGDESRANASIDFSSDPPYSNTIDLDVAELDLADLDVAELDVAELGLTELGGLTEGMTRGVDALFELLMSQRADGSFGWSPELERWLGVRAAVVKAACAAQGEALIATAVVLALLEHEAGNRSDEWAPAAAKARRWLAGRAPAVNVAELLRN